MFFASVAAAARSDTVILFATNRGDATNAAAAAHALIDDLQSR